MKAPATEKAARWRAYVTWWSVLLVSLVVAANVVIPIIVWNSIVDEDDRKFNTAFSDEYDTTFNLVQTQLLRTVRTIENMRALPYVEGYNMSYADFVQSVRLLTRIDAIVSIGWLPLVRDAEKDLVEQRIRAANMNSPNATFFANFTVTEIRMLGPTNYTIVPASGRELYFPIAYIWPSMSPQIRGFDALSLVSFFGNMTQAIDKASATIKDHVRVLSDPQQQGLLAYTPVYSTGANIPSTVAARRSGGVGVLASSAKLTVIMETALRGTDNLHVFLFSEDGQLLYGSPDVIAVYKPQTPGNVSVSYGLRKDSTMTVADRNWLFVAVPTAALHDRETDHNRAVLFTAITAGAIFILLVVTLVGICQLVVAKERTAKAESRRRQIAAMIGYVNHEIRNPLQGVIGLVEHASMKTKDAMQAQSPSKDDLRVVLEDLHDTTVMCNLLSHICNDVLDIRQLEEGRLSIHRQAASFNSILNDVVCIVQSKLSEKPLLTLVVDKSDPDIALECDPVRVKQVVLNFVSNAIKYSDEGLIHVHADIKDASAEPGSTAVGKWLYVSVQDQGRGIADERKPYVFSPFMHANNSGSGRHQGAGLGLYLCSMLMEAMGGHIGFVSTEGVGSTFWFEVPFVRRELDDAVTSDASVSDMDDVRGGVVGHSSTRLEAVIAEEQNRSGRARRRDRRTSDPVNHETVELQEVTIGEAQTDTGADVKRSRRHLVCDDGRINRLVLRRYVESVEGNAVVDEAENGQQAIEMALKTPYDVIWMDVRMPFVDGIEATKRIRAGGVKTVIIGVTGDVTASEIEHYREIGMQHVMSKPVVRKDIQHILAALSSP